MSAGESAHGWVSFATNATSGTLGFSDSAAIRPIVTWSVVASKPVTVTGTLGEPARGEIADPPFTVTITNPHSVPATSPAVQTAPKSGHYLAVTAVFEVDPRVDPFGGEITDGTSFVFHPDRRKAGAQCRLCDDGLRRRLHPRSNPGSGPAGCLRSTRRPPPGS